MPSTRYSAKGSVLSVLLHHQHDPNFLNVHSNYYGKVTTAMRKLNTVILWVSGDHMVIIFPLEEMKGKNVVFIAGGIGLAPVRCIIWNVLDLRTEFKDITIIYGARTVS